MDSAAAQHFTAFPNSVKRFTLRYIKLAKIQATRLERLEQTARLAAQNCGFREAENYGDNKLLCGRV